MRMDWVGSMGTLSPGFTNSLISCQLSDRGQIRKMKLIALLLTELLAQKDCPVTDRCTDLGINEVWKQCKNIFPDVIAVPNGGNVAENPNPARQGDVRNNWATDFHRELTP